MPTFGRPVIATVKLIVVQLAVGKLQLANCNDTILNFKLILIQLAVGKWQLANGSWQMAVG
ncbi:MAG: hypothetical protein WEA59_01350, partial [Ferruginibacter sp.]